MEKKKDTLETTQRISLEKAFDTVQDVQHDVGEEVSEVIYTNTDALAYPMVCSVFHGAVLDNNLEVVSMMLQGGFNPNDLDEAGLAALHKVLSEEMVDLFVRYHADVRIRERENGLTPLHMAAAKGILEVVIALLYHGASIHDSLPETGVTAYDMAVGYRKWRVAHFLEDYEHAAKNPQ